jgi:ubiquinone/menaquinone biosynthesis C-methylase UbiE
MKLRTQNKTWNVVANDVNFNLEIDIEFFSKLVPLKSRILDYGCGYGRTSQTLFEAGYTNLTGVDSSSQMIHRGNLEYPHLSLISIDSPTLKYPDNHFDAIVLCAVLTCIPENQEKLVVIQELQRVLKPGGIVHIVEYCSEEDRIFKSKFGVMMHHQSSDELRILFNGFNKLRFNIAQSPTMSGNQAQAVSFFGQKN